METAKRCFEWRLQRRKHGAGLYVSEKFFSMGIMQDRERNSGASDYRNYWKKCSDILYLIDALL